MTCSKPTRAKEIRRNSEKPRTRYVTDTEYRAVFELAGPWPHVQCAMEFACAKSLAMPQAYPINPHQIRGLSGQKLTESGFQTLWQKLMVKAVEQGVERFTFHDLKSKGVSDSSETNNRPAGTGRRRWRPFTTGN